MLFGAVSIYTSFSLFESEGVTKSKNLVCFCLEIEYNEILPKVFEDSGSLECNVCCVIIMLYDTVAGYSTL